MAAAVSVAPASANAANGPRGSISSGASTGLYGRFLDAWLRATLAVEDVLKDVFQKWGDLVAAFPLRFLGLTMLLTVGFGLGFLNFRTESRGEKLWSPLASDSVDNRDFIASVSTYGKPPLFNEFILATADPAGNMLTVDGIFRLFDVLDVARNFSALGPERAYQAVCFRRLLPNGTRGECAIVNSVLQFWDNNRTRFAEEIAGNETRLLQAVSQSRFPSGGVVYRPSLFGGLVTGPGDAIVRASALSTGMLMLSEPEEAESRAKDWETEVEPLFTAKANELRGAGYSLVYRFADSYDRELERNIGGDILLVVLSYTCMITFLLLTLGDLHVIRGRAGLATAAILLMVLATVTAYGFGSAIDMPFISIHQILWFIIVGVGCDDVYVLTEIFDRTSKRLSIEERVTLTARHGGVAISVTSFTNIAAFACGAWTIIPAVRYFCVYACFSFFFLWLFSMIAFLPLLAFDEHRRQANRYDVFFCFVRQPTNEERESSVKVDAEQPRDVSATTDPDHMPIVTRFLRDRYAPFILHPVTKVVVILVFAAILGVHIYGATTLNEDFNLIDIVPDDSFLVDHDRILKGRFGDSTLRAEVHFRDIDPSVGDNQAQMLTFIDSTRTSRYFVNNVFQSWIHSFVAWYRANPAYNSTLDGNGFLVGANFSVALQEFLLLPQYFDYNQDVHWNAGRTQVLASRVSVFHIILSDSDDRKFALSDTKSLSEASPFNAGRSPSEYRVFIFNPFYIFFEQLLVIFAQLLSNFATSLAAVIFISSIMLVHPGMVLLVGIFVAMMDVHILGSFWWWGLSINTVTVVQLVMAIGLIVDYNLHIAHLFLQQPGSLSGNERVTRTFIKIGSSVLLSAASTFIGVVPLSFAGSEIFRSFFKCFVSIVGVGLSHGMLLLPIVLSLVGPSIPEKFKFAQRAELSEKNAAIAGHPSAPSAMALVNGSKSAVELAERPV